MAKTDLKIISSNSQTGEKITTSIPYVNNSASSGTLKELATKLNAFTMNNYTQADRVQTINVDTEQVVLPKKEQTITTRRQPTKTVYTNTYRIYKIEAQGTIAAFAKNKNNDQYITVGYGTGTGDFSIIGSDELFFQNYEASIDVTLVASGNDEYESSTLTFNSLPSQM